jgi:glycosyltransferase involved in cell wall biosynthesis
MSAVKGEEGVAHDDRQLLDTERNGARRLSVVIPARNEGRNLPYVLERIPDDVFEVIVVDGNSVDDTVAVALAASADIIVITQARTGKGNALAAGFAASRGDYIVMIDADGSMDPAEIGRFVDALDAGADYVKGSRFMAGGGSDDITVVRRWGNRTLNGLTNALFRTDYSDLCYGYNAFRRDCLPVLALPDPLDTTLASRWGDGFEVETLLTTRMTRAGLVVHEVPSFENCRRFGCTNLRTFRDGFRALVTILRERFRPRPSAPQRITPTLSGPPRPLDGAEADRELRFRLTPDRDVTRRETNVEANT